MPLVISANVRDKLSKKEPPVTVREIEQCMENRQGGLLVDTRLKNRTDPPTLWFIAETNQSRKLKIVYIQDGADVIVKSAYDPNPEERRIYAKYC